MSQSATNRYSDWVFSLQSLLNTVVIAIFVVAFIVQAFQIPSESMERTLLTGDYLLVNKLCYGGGGFWDHVLPYRSIKRGDIVVFHYPIHPSQHFVKRVVGVPGDRLRLINRQVYINGIPLQNHMSNTPRMKRTFSATTSPEPIFQSRAWRVIGGCR